jgi:hypothetical protein
MILVMMTRTLTEFLNAENVGRNINDTQLFYAVRRKKNTAVSTVWIKECTALIYYKGEQMKYTTQENKILSEATIDLISYEVALLTYREHR